MNCFAPLAPGESVCPVCGWENDKPQRPGALPVERRLSGRYALGRAKAADGEGITYAALDLETREVVEVREFFPQPLAQRLSDGTVAPVARQEETFARLKQKFLETAMAVSRLRELPAAAPVTEIFEENETAYAVSAFIPAVTLGSYVRQQGGRLSWAQTQALFAPALTALGLANSLGVSHLGLSPQTLRVKPDGTLLITGFGIPQARCAGSPVESEQTPGCAALEQYRAGAVCGEASDVYAVGACMLFALTGKLPKPALLRQDDPRLLIPREILKTLPATGITAIANALQVQGADRTPSFERFRLELSGTPQVVDRISETEAIRRLPSMKQAMPRHRGLPPVVWLLGSLIITLGVLTVIAGNWLKGQGMSFGDLGRLFREGGLTQTETLAPDLVNQPYELWESRNQVLLRVSERVFSDTVQEGNIISQSPLAGEPLEPGQAILVTVSKGPRQRVLPPFEGVPFEELEKRLVDNGFVVEWSEEPSETVEQGVVMGYQGHLPGDAVEVGSTVTVVVSSGP